jgi:putative FmdB family regulatory protein
VPVYEFRCRSCDRRDDLLLGLGETADRPCPDCAGVMRHRPARVGVRYGSWGFRATDSLVRRPGNSDYRTLRENAERIADGE